MASRVLTMSNVGATVSSWTADKDYILDMISTSTNAAGMLLSMNPTLAVGDITAPGSTQLHEDVLFAGAASTNARVCGGGPLNIPISAEKTVYFRTLTAGGSITLLLNEAVEIPV